MELEDAVKAVLSCAAAGTIFAEPEELETVRAYFRRNEGMSFDGDDALGVREPEAGDWCVFIPMEENPPPNRAKISAPISGRIKQIATERIMGRFPYLVEIDDRNGTRVWASRNELQITERVGLS